MERPWATYCSTNDLRNPLSSENVDQSSDRTQLLRKSRQQQSSSSERTWLSILSAMPRLLAGSSGPASTSSLLAHIQGKNDVSRASTGSLVRGVSGVAVLREAGTRDQEAGRKANRQ